MKAIGEIMNQTLPNMIFLREKICEGCGEEVEVYQTTILGGSRKGEKMIVNRFCRCEDKTLAEQALKSHQQMLSKKVREQFEKHSLINPKLMAATFESYEPVTKSQAQAKKSVAQFVQSFDILNPKNILFTGSYGVGKSHLAKVITDGVIEKGHTALFISVPKLLRKLRSTYNRESEVKENDLLKVLETINVLVLDDIGAEKQTEWAEERLFDLIDSRQGLHTIYTTNYSPEGLFQLLGERNFSRIVNEDTNIIEIEGTNHRMADLSV